jgi:dihydrofolate reductase
MYHPRSMRISFLAAVAANGVIGRDNKLPWHLSSDLKRLKALSMGHHVIMGRKTFDEIGRKPLPGRPHVIVSRSPIEPQENVKVVSSVEDALAAIPGSEDEVFILGGGEIFRQMMHRADRMYITQIHADVPGDTYFPDFDDVNEWRLVDREDFEADAKNDYPYSFLTYDRVGSEEHAIPEEG